MAKKPKDNDNPCYFGWSDEKIEKHRKRSLSDAKARHLASDELRKLARERSRDWYLDLKLPGNEEKRKLFKIRAREQSKANYIKLKLLKMENKNDE